jgi:hypothetical protein
MLFDRHQLKGIYLSPVSLQQAHEDYKDKQLRDRVVKYLEKRIRDAAKKRERDKK